MVLQQPAVGSSPVNAGPASAAPASGAVVLGLDANCRTLAEADHLAARWAQHVMPPDAGHAHASLLVCTHFVAGRVAVSLHGLPADLGDPAGAADALSALETLGADTPAAVSLGDRTVDTEAVPGASAERAAEAAARTDGRAVVFAGVGSLTGEVPVSRVLNGSAIDGLAVLGGGEPEPDAVLRTRDHVRPEWSNGVLTLAVSPAGPGIYVPFEVPNPTPCCADHA